jgi:ketosteroid isomerase-like protein
VTANRVELLRRVYADWARGDFSAGWDQLADDVQFIPLDDITDPARTRGRQAVRGFLDDLTESFSELTIEGLEFIDEGDRVLVRTVQRVVGRGSGASGEFEYWMQWVFDEDGQVIRFGAVRDDD